MAGLWYRSGSVSVTQASKMVTGAGTTWKTALNRPDKGNVFYGPDGKAYEIDYVTTETELYLVEAYAGVNASAQSYKIDVRGGTVPELSRQLSTHYAYMQGVIDSLQAVVNGSGDVTITGPDGQMVTIPALSNMLSKSGNLSGIVNPDVALGHLGVSELQVGALKSGSLDQWMAAIGFGEPQRAIIRASSWQVMRSAIGVYGTDDADLKFLKSSSNLSDVANRSAARTTIGAASINSDFSLTGKTVQRNDGRPNHIGVNTVYIGQSSWYPETATGTVLAFTNKESIDGGHPGEGSEIWNQYLHISHSNTLYIRSDINGLGENGQNVGWAKVFSSRTKPEISEVVGLQASLNGKAQVHSNFDMTGKSPQSNDGRANFAGVNLIAHGPGGWWPGPGYGFALAMSNASGNASMPGESAGNWNQYLFLDHLGGFWLRGDINGDGFNGENAGWQRIYTVLNKPTPAEIGAAPAASDAILKSNLEALEPVLDKISNITAFRFDMEGYDHRKIGTIAQDWGKEFPEVVVDVPIGNEMYKGIDALSAIAILLQSIQELKSKVSDLESVIAGSSICDPGSEDVQPSA